MEPRHKRRDQVDLAVEDVAGAWDLGHWEHWHRTPKGSANTSYFVTTDRGRFVVRISNARKTDVGATQEVTLLEHLRARGYPAPRVVPSRAGVAWERVGGAVCLVTERLPGSFPDLDNPGHLAGSARALARFHEEGRRLPDGARPVHGSELDLLREGPALLERVRAVAVKRLRPEERHRFDRARGVLEPAFEEMGPVLESNGALPRMVTHGSLGVSAVLFDGPHLTGVLDYERAAHEARALDLAYTLRALTRRPKDEPGAFDLARVRSFMAAYQGIEALATGEAERLPMVLRAQRLLKVAGKSSNLLAKDALVPQQEKDFVKLVETLELELPRLRWPEEHEDELREAVESGSRT